MKEKKFLKKSNFMGKVFAIPSKNSSAIKYRFDVNEVGRARILKDWSNKNFEYCIILNISLQKRQQELYETIRNEVLRNNK